MSGAVTMRVNGASTVIASLGKVNAAMVSKIKRTMKADAQACLDDSQTNCPVGKDQINITHMGGGTHAYYAHTAGALKGSGKLKVTENSPTRYVVTVSYGGESSTGDTVTYQWYVELGTCKMAAQPYLYPAFLYGQRLLAIDMQGIAAMSTI